MLGGFKLQSQTIWTEVGTISATDVSCKSNLEVPNIYYIGQDGQTTILSDALTQNGLPSSGSLPPNSYFEFAGKVIVDNSLFFEKCHLQFKAGAKLSIEIDEENGSLSFLDSKLVGCDYQWHGIIVTSHNTLNMTNCLIYGAYQAIKLEASTYLKTYKVRFSHNVVGVFASSENDNLTIQTTFLDFKGNVFDANSSPSIGDAVFLPPYNGAPAMPYATAPILMTEFNSPFAGIWMENCEGEQFIGGATANEWNVFRSLRNGIVLSNISTAIQNCKFSDMWAADKINAINWTVYPHRYPSGSQGTNQSVPMTGHGVYSQSTSSLPITFEYQGFPYDPTQSAQEYDFNTRISFPIRCEKLSKVTVDDVDMGSQIDMAITLRSCTGTLNVTNNAFMAYRRGINVLDCSGSTLNILDNRSIGITPGELYSGVASAIHVESVAPNAVLYGQIGPNPSILVGNPGNVAGVNNRVGISLVNVRGTTTNPMDIIGNSVYHANRKITGMYIANCRYLSTRCNSVNGDPQTYSLQNAYGFYTSACRNSTFGCNYTTDTYVGMRFLSNCYRTNLIANQFHNHKTGLELTNTALFSQQGGQTTSNTQDQFGNKWTGSNYTNNRAAWRKLPVATNMNEYTNTRFIVRSDNNYLPIDIIDGSPSVTPPGADVWFSINDFVPVSSVATCAHPSVNCENPQIDNFATVLEAEGLLERGIVVDSLSMGVFTPPLTFSARRDLYELLIKEYDGTVDNPLFTDFITLMSESVLGQLYEVTARIDGELKPTEAQKEALTLLNSSIDSTILLIDVLVTVLQNPLLSDSVATNIKAQIEVHYDEIANYKAQYLTLSAAIDGMLLDTNEDIVEDNADVSAATDYATNEKLVNDIWLNTFARGNYNLQPDDVATLHDIATQCPVSGGDAVYQALAMYNMVAANIDPDYEDICEAVGIIMLQQEQQNTLDREAAAKQKQTLMPTVTPNPADAELTLAMPRAMTGAIGQISDMTGRLVLEFMVGTSRNQVISTQTLPNGVYILTLIEGGNTIVTEKVIIAH